LTSPKYISGIEMQQDGPDMGPNGSDMGPNGSDMGPNRPYMDPNGVEKDENPILTFWIPYALLSPKTANEILLPI